MLFFELIQVALGRRQRLSLLPSASEWQHLFQLSMQHALLGICYQGISSLPREQWPTEELLVDWIWQAQRIREQNELLSRRCVEVCRRLEGDGFNPCLLKGHSNARLYGALSDLRQPGDIDVWVTPKHFDSFRKARRQTIGYVRSSYPNALLRYHHIEFPIFSDVEVELHFVPIYLNNPWLNHRLNRWYRAQHDRQMRHQVRLTDCEVAQPDAEFNLLYQLLHIYKHIFEEGIGLRQLMDYYFVLANDEFRPSAADIQHTNAMIRQLHLERLAGAVMYVLHEVMALPDERLLCPPRKDEGLALLSEIMQSGNFGHFDSRGENTDGGHDLRSQLHRYWRKTKRNIVLSYYYPYEGLCEPLFHLYHYLWQVLNLWKL